MSEKIEALRLAEVLDLLWLDGQTPRQAAAELRRLHAECEHHKAWVAHITAENKSLEAQRDALLEALKSSGLFLHHCWCDVQMNDYSFEKLNQQMAVVDAAIAKAVEEGENHAKSL